MAYLGSIAIDMTPDDAVYHALVTKYEDMDQKPIRNNAVLWIMRLEDAIAAHEKRNVMIENV